MATTSPPATTQAQRLGALERANSVRLIRSKTRKRWKSLDRSGAINLLIQLLYQAPDWSRSWRVEQVIGYLPKVGEQRVTKVLTMAGISRRRTIGGLTDRQRECLVAALDILRPRVGVPCGKQSRQTGSVNKEHRSNGRLRWRARACIDGRRVTVGYFDSPEEARAAILRASGSASAADGPMAEAPLPRQLRRAEVLLGGAGVGGAAAAANGFPGPLGELVSPPEAVAGGDVVAPPGLAGADARQLGA